MKIIFVQPKGTGLPPLGLLYLIGVLKSKGYDDLHLVSLTDPPVSEKRSFDHLLSLLKQHPDVVCVSSLTPEWTKAVKICEVAKEYAGKVMVGGPHPSIFREELLEKYPFIDIVVFGEADNTIHEIISRIEKGSSLEGIKGVAYRENGKILRNEQNPLIKDLDAIPFPDRDCLDFPSYHTPFTILTSRGCPYGCIYCFKPVHGSVWRGRSPENVISEMEYLLNRYPEVFERNRTIAIIDDTFNLNLERAKKICDEVVERELDIKLSCVNGLHVRSVDYELFQKLKKAGCSEVWFGIESGNPTILKRINKGITTDMVKNAVKQAKRAKIPVVGGHFIIGLADETIETARDTVAFAKGLGLNIMGVNHANVLPGSKLWDWVMEHGKLLYPIENMDFSSYKSIGEPAFETPEFTADERRKVYAEAVAVSDSLWRHKGFAPGKVLKFIFSLRSPDDAIWAAKRLKFFMLERDFSIKGFPIQPSLSKKH